MRVFTDLDLNGNTPLRTQPVVGEWGPQQVMPTKNKRRARWLWVVAFVVVVAALFFFGHYVYGVIISAGS